MSTIARDIEAKLSFEFVSDMAGNTEGKNSDVFIARDKQLDSEIVIKRVAKSEFKDGEDYFAEAKILYATQHPHVAQINLACEDDDYVYFSMPIYRNGSLNSLINKCNLTVREIINYSIDYLSALHYVHSKKLLHLDIKPTNLLLTNSSSAILTDFGLSKYVNEDGIANSLTAYPYHVSPEQLKNGRAGFPTDIYQAGVTLYRMCYGNNILKSQLTNASITDWNQVSPLITSGKFPDRDIFLPHIPKKLRSIIKKSIALDPDKRYKFVLDMLNELSKIEDNLDWTYSEIDTEIIFFKNKDDKKYEIIMKSVNSKWHISYRIINLTNNKPRKDSKYPEKVYTKRIDAFNEISNWISSIN